MPYTKAGRPSAHKFNNAITMGEVTERSGWHNLIEAVRFGDRCGCEPTTDKGAYRDVVVDLDGETAYFYHQSNIVTEHDGVYRLDSCGHRTRTTKERINRHTPASIHVYQEDFDWYVRTPRGVVPFKDGMTLR